MMEKVEVSGVITIVLKHEGTSVPMAEVVGPNDEHTLSYEELKKNEGKVMAFAYNGGSNPGELRVVKVEEVETGAVGEVYIKGHDLEIALEHGAETAYRCYQVSKIVGNVSVVTKK